MERWYPRSRRLQPYSRRSGQLVQCGAGGGDALHGHYHQAPRRLLHLADALHRLQLHADPVQQGCARRDYRRRAAPWPAGRPLLLTVGRARAEPRRRCRVRRVHAGSTHRTADGVRSDRRALVRRHVGQDARQLAHPVRRRSDGRVARARGAALGLEPISRACSPAAW